mgnify:CR=1 FL=1
MKKLLLLSLLALSALGVRSQSADKFGNWKLIASDEYPAEDVGVATYTVTTDFNADPTGVKNSLDAFQTALTKLGENRRGGMETAGGRQAGGRNHPDGRYAKWI